MRQVLLALAGASTAAAKSACPAGFRSATGDSGILVCATERVSNRALEHAVGVMNRLLDFDRNGTPDSLPVLAELHDSGAFYAVFPTSARSTASSTDWMTASTTLRGVGGGHGR